MHRLGQKIYADRRLRPPAPHRSMSTTIYSTPYRPYEVSAAALYLVFLIKIVVHESRDDGGLSDALVSEEDEFVLGEGRDVGHVAACAVH